MAKNSINNTKNIVFDVGEVLIEYRWKQMLMDYGLSEEDAIRVGTELFDDPDKLWSIFDLGTFSEEEIIAEYCRKHPEDTDAITWFISHGEYMHVPREDVWEKVHGLKQKGYGIYLLSNYSENLFHKHTKNAAFMKDIDGMVVSYQIHKTKPDPAIYLHLLQTYHLQPETCLFFDDRPANTEAAKKLGIQTITVTSKELLMGELEKL